MIVIAALFSLTACSGQQVQDVALFTVGAALKAAIEFDEPNDERGGPCGEPVFEETAPDLFRDSRGSCSSNVRRREEERREALLEAAEAHRAAQRRAELDAALDAYLSQASVTEPEPRSVVLSGRNPDIPPDVVERFTAAVPEASPED